MLALTGRGSLPGAASGAAAGGVAVLVWPEARSGNLPLRHPGTRGGRLPLEMGARTHPGGTDAAPAPLVTTTTQAAGHGGRSKGTKPRHERERRDCGHSVRGAGSWALQLHRVWRPLRDYGCAPLAADTPGRHPRPSFVCFTPPMPTYS